MKPSDLVDALLPVIVLALIGPELWLAFGGVLKGLPESAVRDVLMVAWIALPPIVAMVAFATFIYRVTPK